jgi:hypothetical protein
MWRELSFYWSEWEDDNRRKRLLSFQSFQELVDEQEPNDLASLEKDRTRPLQRTSEYTRIIDFPWEELGVMNVRPVCSCEACHTNFDTRSRLRSRYMDEWRRLVKEQVPRERRENEPRHCVPGYVFIEIPEDEEADRKPFEAFPK